jgi:hypothetical protein
LSIKCRGRPLAGKKSPVDGGTILKAQSLVSQSTLSRRSNPNSILLTETTYGDFAVFAKNTGFRSTGCIDLTTSREHKSKSWSDSGFAQADRYPVVCVSFDDVSQYIHWLNQMTRRCFRLPSETISIVGCSAAFTVSQTVSLHSTACVRRGSNSLLLRLIQRLSRLLTRLGNLAEEAGMTYLATPEADPALGVPKATTCTYRIVLGPRKS